MEQKVVDAVTLGAMPHAGFNIIELALNADWVVKSVMLILLFASLFCWAIIFDKLLKMRRLRSRADLFEDSFWSGGSLEDLYDRIGNVPADPMSSVFAAAMPKLTHGRG